MACETHHADVMPRRSFYGYDVTLLQRKVVVVSVIPFAGVLKLHFYEVARVVIPRNVGVVVVGIELFVLSAATFC